MTFENDEARRAYFLEKLKEKLKDPDILKIEGFPMVDVDPNISPGWEQDSTAILQADSLTECPD